MAGSRLSFLFWRRRHTAAKQLDGILQALAALPEIGPEITLFLETRKDGFYIQRFGAKARTQFARQQGSGDRRLRECSYGVGGSQRAAVSVLLHVDQHAAR